MAFMRYSLGFAAYSSTPPRFRVQATVFLHSQPHYSTNPQISTSKPSKSPIYTVSDFHRMLRSKPIPPVLEFCNVLITLSKSGHHSKVLSLYREMGMNPVLVPLNLFTFNVVINSCCCLNNGFGVCYGFSLIGAIVKNGFQPNTSTFNNLIKGLFLEGRIRNDDARELLHKLVLICQPNVSAYVNLINRLCEMGNVGVAIRLLKDTKGQSFEPSNAIYRAIIEGLVKNGRVDVAFGFVGEMVKRGVVPSRVTYKALMKGLLFGGEANAALELFHKVYDLLEDACWDPIGCSIVIDGLCRTGNVGMAIDLFGDLKKRRCTLGKTVYAALIDGLSKNGRVKETFSLLDEMVENSLVPDVATYSMIMNELCREGLLEEAKELFLKMEENGYNAVIKGLCVAGKHRDAQELLNCLSSKGIDPDVIAYNTLINGFCQEGLLEEAEELLVKMEEGSGCKPDEATFNTMICAYLKWNRRDKAMELEQKMVERKLANEIY